jgi:predicted nuclease of restriction endonuclease-like (RecB) superfamily
MKYFTFAIYSLALVCNFFGIMKNTSEKNVEGALISGLAFFILGAGLGIRLMAWLENKEKELTERQSKLFEDEEVYYRG